MKLTVFASGNCAFAIRIASPKLVASMIGRAGAPCFGHTMNSNFLCPLAFSFVWGWLIRSEEHFRPAG